MARQQRFSFRKFQTRWEKQKGSLAIEIARKAENQFKDNFRLGGFLSSYLEKWSPRKKADPGRALLVKSGRLKRGVRAAPGSNFQKITIANDVPYAKIHNEGGRINLGQRSLIGSRRQVGATSINMPKRQFIGASQALNIKIKTAIRRVVSSIFVN